MQSVSNERRSATRTIKSALARLRPDLGASKLDRRVETIYNDVVVLARCAKSQCLVTYGDVVKLRGHGIARSPHWLDAVYSYAVAPLGFPDLTMLVVVKRTTRPSDGIFINGRTRLSEIEYNDVPAEQSRCFRFKGYDEALGCLPPIPAEYQAPRLWT